MQAKSQRRWTRGPAARGVALVLGLGLGLAATGARAAVNEGASFTAPPPGDRAGYFDIRRDVDGGFVLAGFVADPDGNRDYLVTRLVRSDDGSLEPDKAFGTAGTGHVTEDVGGPEDRPTGLAIDSQGRIVVVGHDDADGGDIQVLRFTADGQLDGSFGDGGIVRLAVTGCGRAWDVAVTPADKVVLAGTRDACSPDSDAIVARLAATGDTDGTFDGDDGVQGITTPGSFDQFRAVAVRPDNGRVVAGGISGGDGEGEDLSNDLLAVDFPAVDGSGNLRSFVHDVSGSGDRILDLEINGEGRVLFVGYTRAAQPDSVALAGRLDNMLRLDTGYDSTTNSDGLVEHDLTVGKDFFTDVEFAGSGRVLLTGAAEPSGNRDALVARLDSTGQLDGDFISDTDRTGWRAFEPSDGGRDNGRGLTRDGAGNLVLAGNIDDETDPAVDGFGTTDQGFALSLELTDKSRSDSESDIDGTSGGSSDDGAVAGGSDSDDDGGSSGGGGGGGATGPLALLIWGSVVLAGAGRRLRVALFT